MERRYTARARAWGIGVTNDKETIGVQFQITTENAEFNHITWYGFFTEKTWERTIESLRYCGWEGDDIAELTDSRGGLDKNEVELVIDDEDYKGNLVAKVKWVNRVGVALKAPLQGDRLKAFSASMRSQIRAKDASEGRKPAPRSQPAGPRPTEAVRAEDFGPPPMSDDDIPF